ncbi:myosin-binding protein 2-like [Rutidosis leptorrhynchoides]|uniref:myosin-binding protein 2-like n=1 Tax=Rutidosis leptorrhynchoides TaxID=125765 RepID=UPI003A99AA8D
MAATHKTTLTILAYAALEWILILMLLFNSIFSYLIRKFATYYSLKPPCFWCSTIDHLFEPNNNVNPNPNLICEAHAAEIFNLYYGPDRPMQTPEPWCSCSAINLQANSVDKLFGNASKFKSDSKENKLVQVMNHPVENKSGHIQVFDHIIPLEWTDSSSSCSRCSSLNGDENMVVADDQVVKQEDMKDKVVTIDSLQAELKAERLAVYGLYIELDEERNASAIAANQALAMITKLQEEKIALQIEYVQNKRMMEEQAEYDHEVLQLLNEIVMKLEHDKIELENELDVYKEKLYAYEGKNKAKMTLCDDSCSIVTKNSPLVDDTNVLDLKDLTALEESMVDFEVEGLWILNELKDLDETLTTLTDDLDEHIVGKGNLEGEDRGYNENRASRFFAVIDEQVEASHAAWSRCSP